MQAHNYINPGNFLRELISSDEDDEETREILRHAVRAAFILTAQPFPRWHLDSISTNETQVSEALDESNGVQNVSIMKKYNHMFVKKVFAG